MKEISVREGWNPSKRDDSNHHDKEKGEIMDLLPIPDL
jgi:hypothetical protein